MSLTGFLAERDAMLRSLDPVQAAAFWRKYNRAEPPGARDILLAGMHKARLECRSMTEEERELSRRWLREHGYRKLDGTPP